MLCDFLGCPVAGRRHGDSELCSLCQFGLFLLLCPAGAPGFVHGGESPRLLPIRIPFAFVNYYIGTPGEFQVVEIVVGMWSMMSVDLL